MSTEPTGSCIFKRAFGHVEGNWPSHVYLSISQTKKIKLLQQACIKHYENLIDTDSTIVHKDDGNLHISLSKPFVLRHHQIEPFLKSLSQKIRVLAPFTGKRICEICA